MSVFLCETKLPPFIYIRRMSSFVTHVQVFQQSKAFTCISGSHCFVLIQFKQCSYRYKDYYIRMYITSVSYKFKNKFRPTSSAISNHQVFKTTIYFMLNNNKVSYYRQWHIARLSHVILIWGWHLNTADR